MQPISRFLTDYAAAESKEAEADHIDRVALLESAVEDAQAALTRAVDELTRVVNAQADVRRAGRLLKELGYALDDPAAAASEAAVVEKQKAQLPRGGQAL